MPSTDAPAAIAEPDGVQQANETLRGGSEWALPQDSEFLWITNSTAAADRLVTLEERLGILERALRLQHQTEMEAVQSSNRTVLIVAGLLAGAVLIGIFSVVLVFARAINWLSAVSGHLPVGGGWGRGPALPALGEGESRPGSRSDAARAEALFTDAIERLERRIRQIEQTAAPTPLAALENATGPGRPADGGSSVAAAAMHPEGNNAGCYEKALKHEPKTAAS